MARALIEDLTQNRIDPSTTILTPFDTDFGRRIVFGKQVYIDIGILMTDLGV
ncbi:hypothetical protein AB6O97_04435 [Streptococcus mutans]|uniref:hypothetical protein n=1 Tax=Streptococcus mutans TaxID=1309 RepID=UPI001CFC6767|nr:hypothetical protein [Streptococcus mutans]MCB5077650.1 hypothetical protein [Streptococcus mutans]MCB5127640.1 hypothetical protein [Streptococcus mutans]MCB5130395.1 hypothetical protein [Streptococcus mutans]MCB5140513.1 hypothetical protein [Streptococcus mutans]MCB5150971.1 hypothetical protein [Streptococcus mutans]